MNNNIERKKLNSMNRIKYIDIIETISIHFIVCNHNYTNIEKTN